MIPVLLNQEATREVAVFPACPIASGRRVGLVKGAKQSTYLVPRLRDALPPPLLRDVLPQPREPG